MDPWTLAQLADSALPTGAFAHSGGLEALLQLRLGEAGGRMAEVLDEALWSCGSSALPWVTAAHASPDRVRDLDAACDAALPSHVANRASRLQGQAFLRAAAATWPAPLAAMAEAARAERWPCHLAPIQGAALGRLGAACDDARRLFLFSTARGMVAAAVRLGAIGPFEGQRLLATLGATADEILRATADRGPDDAAVTAPLLEIAQGHQDRLYSRLFQS